MTVNSSLRNPVLAAIVMAACSERPSREFHRSCWGLVALPMLNDFGVEYKEKPVELDLHEPGGDKGGAAIRPHAADDCEGFNCAAWVGRGSRARALGGGSAADGGRSAGSQPGGVPRA
eukprot:6190421-Pleurochrysis_carterae.AAC.1